MSALLSSSTARGQVTHSEAGHRPGAEVLLTRAAVAEYLDVAPIRKLEDPEIRFGIHQPEPKNMFVEVRQFPGAVGSRATPAKTCDLHVCKYHRQAVQAGLTDSARPDRVSSPAGNPARSSSLAFGPACN